MAMRISYPLQCGYFLEQERHVAIGRGVNWAVSDMKLWAINL